MLPIVGKRGGQNTGTLRNTTASEFENLSITSSNSANRTPKTPVSRQRSNSKGKQSQLESLCATDLSVQPNLLLQPQSGYRAARREQIDDYFSRPVTASSLGSANNANASSTGGNSVAGGSETPPAQLHGIRLTSLTQTPSGGTNDLFGMMLVNGQANTTHPKSASIGGKPDQQSPKPQTLQRQNSRKKSPTAPVNAPKSISENERAERSIKSARQRAATTIGMQPPSQLHFGDFKNVDHPHPTAHESATAKLSPIIPRHSRFSIGNAGITSRAHSSETLEIVTDGPSVETPSADQISKHVNNRPGIMSFLARPDTHGTHHSGFGLYAAPVSPGSLSPLPSSSPQDRSPQSLSPLMQRKSIKTEPMNAMSNNTVPTQPDSGRKLRGQPVEPGHPGSNALLAALMKASDREIESPKLQHHEHPPSETPPIHRTARQPIHRHSVGPALPSKPAVHESRSIIHDETNVHGSNMDSLKIPTSAIVTEPVSEDSPKEETSSTRERSNVTDSHLGVHINESRPLLRNRSVKRSDEAGSTANDHVNFTPPRSKRTLIADEHAQLHPHPPSQSVSSHPHPHLPHSATPKKGIHMDEESSRSSSKTPSLQHHEGRSVRIQLENTGNSFQSAEQTTDSTNRRARRKSLHAQSIGKPNQTEMDAFSPESNALLSVSLSRAQAGAFASLHSARPTSGRRRSISTASGDQNPDNHANISPRTGAAVTPSAPSAVGSNAAATAAALAGRVRRMSMFASHITGQTQATANPDDPIRIKDPRQHTNISLNPRPVSAKQKSGKETKTLETLHTGDHKSSRSGSYSRLLSDGVEMNDNPKSVSASITNMQQNDYEQQGTYRSDQRRRSKSAFAKSHDELLNSSQNASGEPDMRPRSNSVARSIDLHRHGSESPANVSASGSLMESRPGSKPGSRPMSRRGSISGNHAESHSFSRRGSQSSLMDSSRSVSLSQVVAEVLNKPTAAGRTVPRNIMLKLEQKRAAAALAIAAANNQANMTLSNSDLTDGMINTLDQFDEENEEQVQEFQNQEEPEPEKSKGIHARNARGKWRFLLYISVFGRLLSRFYKDIFNKLFNTPYAPQVAGNDTLLFMLKNHQAKADPTLTAKVFELLKGTREEKELEMLERLLTIRVKAMQRFTMDQRLKFCKIMHLESFASGSVIVKEGHVSKAFYFILNGQVEIFKIKDGLKYRLNALNAGDSFGDRTMNMLNDKRTASVATTADSDFLKIDKSDFFDITNIRDEKHMANHLAELARIPIFASSQGGFVEKMASFCQFVTFEPNEAIVLEGSSNLKVYWILKGTCRCFKVVPFLRKYLGTTYESGDKTVLVPYDPAVAAASGFTVPQSDEIVRQLLAIQELEFGSYFPDFPAPPDEINPELFHRFDRVPYIKLLETEDPTKPYSKAAASVVACTKVEVVCINRAEFAKIAPESVLLELISQDHVFNVPLIQLQEAYLDKLNWDNYRKKVAGEVTARRGAKK